MLHIQTVTLPLFEGNRLRRFKLAWITPDRTFHCGISFSGFL